MLHLHMNQTQLHVPSSTARATHHPLSSPLPFSSSFSSLVASSYLYLLLLPSPSLGWPHGDSRPLLAYLFSILSTVNRAAYASLPEPPGHHFLPLPSLSLQPQGRLRAALGPSICSQLFHGVQSHLNSSTVLPTNTPHPQLSKDWDADTHPVAHATVVAVSPAPDRQRHI